MELHERIVTTKPAVATAPQKEPFADLKNSIHMLVISELGPQLTGQVIDPVGMRDRVIADIRRHLSGETGISRDDRERLTNEIADDILGYGPLERLLADDSITEIMVNGPGEIWIERQGRLYETTVRFTRRLAPAPHHQPHGRPDRAPHRRVVADGRRAPPRRLARQRDHPAALALGPAPHDPQVLAQAPRAAGHGQHRLALARSRSTSCGAASWRSSTSSSRAVRARERRRC